MSGWDCSASRGDATAKTQESSRGGWREFRVSGWWDFFLGSGTCFEMSGGWRVDDAVDDESGMMVIIKKRGRKGEIEAKKGRSVRSDCVHVSRCGRRNGFATFGFCGRVGSMVTVNAGCGSWMDSCGSPLSHFFFFLILIYIFIIY